MMIKLRLKVLSLPPDGCPGSHSTYHMGDTEELYFLKIIIFYVFLRVFAFREIYLSPVSMLRKQSESRGKETRELLDQLKYKGKCKDLLCPFLYICLPWMQRASYSVLWGERQNFQNLGSALLAFMFAYLASGANHFQRWCY